MKYMYISIQTAELYICIVNITMSSSMLYLENAFECNFKRYCLKLDRIERTNN